MMIDPNVQAYWVQVQFGCRCTTGFATAQRPSLLEDIEAFQSGDRPTLTLTDMMDGEMQFLRHDKVEHIAVRPMSAEEVELTREGQGLADLKRLAELRKTIARWRGPADADEDGDDFSVEAVKVDTSDGLEAGLKKAFESAIGSAWGRRGDSN